MLVSHNKIWVSCRGLKKQIDNKILKEITTMRWISKCMILIDAVEEDLGERDKV